MDNNLQAKKLEEILLEMRLVTEDDILTASIISIKEHSPIGTVLVSMEVITLNQLKEALKLQYGVDAVTEEQISSLNEDIMDVLPEDFVKMYKVIPISCEGKNLVVAMVNPNDKQAILNIITYTEMKPTILVITHYEFQKFVKEYYKNSKWIVIHRLIERRDENGNEIGHYCTTERKENS